MRSRDLLLIARRQAGVSQGELAGRLGVARETVARWEAGAHDPSFESLQRAVAACGLELTPQLHNPDGSLRVLVADQLALAPLERIRALLDEVDAARCEEALRVIASLSVFGVLCGPVGAVLLGAPNRPWSGRVDVTIEPSQTAGLLGDLLELGALPGEPEERWGETHRREPWTLPGGGELAAMAFPAGTRGARDLRRDAVTVSLDPLRRLVVAHPRDLLRIAYASPDPRDHAMAPGYAALLDALNTEPTRLTA